MATNIFTEYSDRVRYFLSSKSFGTIQIPEPIGWDEDEKEFGRNKEEHGIFTTLSNALRFTKLSKDFIELVSETDGINAEIRLTKESKNDQTDVWETAYTGYLDLSTEETENNQLSLKFNSGGLESILKNREGEDVEIDRKDTIDGKVIDTLKTVNVELNGRRIFLESTWKAAPMTYQKELLIKSTAGEKRYLSNTLPFDIDKKSHEQANPTFDGSDGNEHIGQSTMMLLSNIDRTRKFKVKVSDLKVLLFTNQSWEVDNGYASISLVVYANGSNFDRTGNVNDIWRFDFSGKDPIYSGNVFIDEQTFDITLNQGESLGLEVMIYSDFKSDILGGWGRTYKRNLFYTLKSGTIKIQEDSEFKKTACKAVKPFELANRLVEIITGRKNAVKSEILQSGKWKNLLITHGFWIRGFSRDVDASLPEEDRKFKPLTTNFRDFTQSLMAVANIGVGIEKIGAREYVVIEDLKYFYNRNTTIKLPNKITKIKRSTDPTSFYKSIEIGFEKGGEYEEAMGLDEYNIRNSYTTCIHRVENKYTKLSKYRADTYGMEFARRKPYFDYPTEDTSYDQDIFFIDCKDEPKTVTFPTWPFRGATKTLESYIPRLWNDDFNQMPTGVFSPETAFNLRITPFNSMLRHGWNISAGLTKYSFEKIKYSSSKGNSSLVTLYAENGEIENVKLEKPRYYPRIIEFEHICNDEIMKMVEGRSNILGKEIRNCYGLVEFINENGEIEKGYLLALKPNGAGNFKLLQYQK
ncbi:hypothetical protein MG290_01695 [Flavobacterium sp. CBA20B-1]|uniref:hypothetical protein n=1 Tax=unclassified Flavobacterium TaxID=196869 RepID=UPI002224D6E9|nr:MULTISPECIES: hypothetical protein [unclassified Flavobacterium]WCM42409.1 hypothetical protein MG290_01695 [Flavobacterium sp. CBA20B-1]